ncbi:MAG: hypothetical protein JWO99_683 [Candidatus Saccharibacteria bacterium]|nr:hypothetical protein [Candidatus Saccharibacteria bacterium]
MPQRLPIVNSDDGSWGTILNQYLKKEHYDDATDNAVNGGHQTVTIRAGTSAAGTAPLKIASGTLLTTPEVGAVEFVTNRLYYTQTTGPTRMTVLAVNDASGASGDTYYRNSTGDLVRLPVGSSSYVLTVSSGVPTWAPAPGAGSGLTQQQVMAITTLRI